MPRLVKYRPNRISTKVRAERMAIKRYRKGTWVDPFPWVHGTLPEKMVYAELSRRGIPFLFLNEINFKIPEIDFNKDYQADFVIPSLNIIIEVQGAFWHSKPKTVESDAFKFAIYQLKGYKVLAWWDYEIMTDLAGLIAREPKLTGASIPLNFQTGSSELKARSRKKPDTSKGIRTLNRKRANAQAWKRKAVRVRV